MKLTTITVTYGRKVNLGDYNNANIEVTLGADLDEGDDAEAALADLWQTAKSSVKAQVLPLVRKQYDQAAEIFGGLPTELQQEIIDANHRTHQ